MADGGAVRGLTLDDVLDLRAYERVRDDYRAKVIAMKKNRRVALGPIMTLVFECLDTVRFQVQEMARVEKMTTDEQIRAELDVYNPLIPEPGELSATLFVELTDEESLRRWLPALVGIERAVVLRIGEGGTAQEVRSMPEAAHAEKLTREDVTSSVHYVRFGLDEGQVEAFAAGPVAVAIDLPAYREQTVLDDATRGELVTDLRP